MESSNEMQQPKWIHQLPAEEQKKEREWWKAHKNDPNLFSFTIPIPGSEVLAKWIKEEVLGEASP